MDPISIITLCWTTTTATYQCAMTLHQFINSLKTIDAEIEALVAEFTGLRRVLDAIGSTFANPILKSEKATSRQNHPIWAAVAGSLNDCRNTVEQLSLMITRPDRSGKKKGFFRQTIKIFKFSEMANDVALVRTQIHTHVNSLQLSLQMVSILASSLTPYAAAEAVTASVANLTQAFEDFRLRESRLAEAEQNAEKKYAPHCAQTGHTAGLILSHASELLSSDSSHTFSAREQDESRSALDLIMSDYRNSIFEVDDDDATALGSDDEEPDEDSDSNETELDLVKILFAKGDELFKQCEYLDSEKYYRDGLQHLQSVSKDSEGIPIVQVRLNLVVICQRREKWDEAELMLLVLSRVEPGQKANSKTLQAYHLLSQTFLCEYDFEQALEYCQRAMTGRRKFLGKTHHSYYASLRLLALIHEANGDPISASVYLKKIPAGPPLKEAEAANSLVIDRFSGYSNVESLRMTLAEKQAALQGLAEGDFLAKLRPNCRPPELTVFQRPVMFRVGADSLNLGQALFWAAGRGKELVVRWLLARGADPNSERRGTTPLMDAAHEGKDDVCRTLLKAGADVNAVDRSHRTALLWAAIWGHESCVRTLILFGAEIDKADESGCTPMMDAAQKGHDSIVRLLLAHGANIEAKSDQGKTALYFAADASHAEVLLSLVKAGANVNISDKSGKTPLLILATSGEDRLIRALVEHGADVNAVDGDGDTALMKLRSPVIVEYLIQHGASVNAKNKVEKTALWLAASWKKCEVMRVLLKHGAEMTSKAYDRNVFEEAEIQGCEECMKILREHGAPET